MSLTHKENSSIPEKNSYIHFKDFNKLKDKYESKINENKKLRECLDKLIDSYDSIKNNKKAVEEMFQAMKELIKNYKNLFKPKEEFSTPNSSYEYVVIGNNNMKSTIISSHSLNFNQINKLDNRNNLLNLNLIKKIEEMEAMYNDLSNNFESMVAKYKILKEENFKIDSHNIILLDQIAFLNKEYNMNLSELNDCYVTIERFKEIDKCILDSAINTLFLNFNGKKKIKGMQENNINNNHSYILCEPVPTFVKFINKYTK
jgi:hypothetical protein